MHRMGHSLAKEKQKPTKTNTTMSKKRLTRRRKSGTASDITTVEFILRIDFFLNRLVVLILFSAKVANKTKKETKKTNKEKRKQISETFTVELSNKWVVNAKNDNIQWRAGAALV